MALRTLMALTHVCAVLAAFRGSVAPCCRRALLRSPPAVALESGAPGGGGGMVSELLIAQLLYLQYDSPSKPLIMYINSPGTTTEQGQPVGFETEAFSIADTMAYVEAPIQTVLVGKAYGLAAMLLACGDKGSRSALPYGTVMLHQPRGQQAQGQASDIAIKAREVLLNRKVALDIMSQATGVTVEKLTEDTNRCMYLDAEAAKAYGIVDKIVDNVNKANPTAALLNDVSAVSRGLG